MMENLYSIFYKLLKNTQTDFKRYLFHRINWKNRLIVIKGARGVGKTTLLLQYIKENLPLNEEVLYASLDNIWFSENRLVDFADDFVRNGGKFLFLDEVHKYPGWALEIKNVYDQHPDLHIVITGSSILHILQGYGDLSRRVVSYELAGLSFREFLQMEKLIRMEPVSLLTVLKNHVALSLELNNQIKPLFWFKKYLEYSYYPYYSEDRTVYHQRLLNTINVVLETDLPAVENIDYYSVYKIKKLLYVISGIVPFTPNISKLSNQIGVTRPTLLRYLDYLKNAGVVNLLNQQTKSISLMAKPEKIYLNNTNIAYALAEVQVDAGNIRETFFYNQLNNTMDITATTSGDFKVEGEFIFEIGGKNKTFRQIQQLNQAFIAADEIETGYKNKIPLFLFGLLY